jgi:glutamine synthetase
MPTLRFQALREASNRKPVQFEETDRKSTIFGSNVFNDKTMKPFNFDAFKGVQGAVQHGTKIDRKLADYIAMGMKEWALAKGDTLHTLVSAAYRNYCRNMMLLETEVIQ